MPIAQTLGNARVSPEPGEEKPGSGTQSHGAALFNASVPVFQRNLVNLCHVLNTAEQYARDHQIAPTSLTDARLADDMFPLYRQIHVVTDTAKGTAFRLAGLDVPQWKDVETTFSELQARISKTQNLLALFSAGDFERSAGTDIALRFAGRDLKMPAADYLHNLALPNFFFHASIAYGIVRSQGVPLGKFDFLGSLPLNLEKDQVQ